MRAGLLIGSLLLAASTCASAAPERIAPLVLLAEYPVLGMSSGNLSGLAQCGDELLAVSDRDDRHIYRLQVHEQTLQAEALAIQVPPVPPSALPWGVLARAWLAGPWRGGQLDFEGISCDAAGNRYLLSEARASVLRVDRQGQGEWLRLPQALVRQARASGMLLQANALLEGIAVAEDGQRLWLAAERQRRGLLLTHWQGGRWRCLGNCVLLSESTLVPAPAVYGERRLPSSFNALSLHGEKLFTLESHHWRLCRRHAQRAEVERCWSYGEFALDASRRYRLPYGMAEALQVDAEGAWIGVDNGGQPRGDGERRPIVWRVAAPAHGWLAP